ncbi:pyruvate dehydrogenase E1 component subunit alpha, mitochondrial isoform X2 [Halyomorpha halys]|nr:pyruvate dehydrogenase E1 component subunit alpha, mitochondrial-like isoform X2 [Halyomorpha halys]
MRSLSLRLKSFFTNSATIATKNFNLHKLEETPPKEAIVTKNEAIQYYKQMVAIRWLEEAAGKLYEQKMIRGFCHLQTGQEAIAVGIKAAMRPEDSLISGYRIHGLSYLMGLTLLEVIAELLGKQSGASKGKGGSMHLYGKNFYGGNGIVGAQVPLGAGIALASKYRKTGGVCFTIYGDGAAMQGQIFETFNMAKLWNLPCVFVCENNGQALSLANSTVTASGISKVETTNFYTLGNYIPGIQADGTDVITVREVAKFAINHIVLGKGPIILELVTPSVDLDHQDEISKRKDPIQLFRKSVGTAGMITEEEFKLIEESTKKEVEESVTQGLRDVEPGLQELKTEVYSLSLETQVKK